MNDHSLIGIYEILRQDLITWVGNNQKLRGKITPHDLNYLFEFHKKKGLAIDLCRFDKEYYCMVFHPPEEKQDIIADLVGKVILVMRSTLISMGREEINLTITVKNRVFEVSHYPFSKDKIILIFSKL